MSFVNSYTQVVDRPVGPPRPPVLTPSKAASGDRSFFQSLMDVVVGDGPELGEVMVCSNCQANNGLVAKNAIPDLWACKVCGVENKK
jgi:hypothetical protein